MARNLDDIIRSLPPARRAKIDARAAELVEEYQTLQELRKARKRTQEQMAKALGMKQANVSQLEQRTDMLLSTLQKAVAALGGTLELVATFPDRHPVVLSGLSEDAAKPPSVRRRKAPRVTSRRKIERRAAHPTT